MEKARGILMNMKCFHAVPSKDPDENAMKINKDVESLALALDELAEKALGER
jgi:hypothetical protein